MLGRQEFPILSSNRKDQDGVRTEFGQNGDRGEGPPVKSRSWKRIWWKRGVGKVLKKSCWVFTGGYLLREPSCERVNGLKTLN
jgi:hypothetical protein